MIGSVHASRADLLEILHGDGDDEKTQRIGEHLHECDQCREAMDLLAAESLMWQKTPRLLGDSAALDFFSDSTHHPAVDANQPTSAFSTEPDARNTPDNSSAKDSTFEGEDWQFPVHDLLDVPNHPEMLGRVGQYDIECEVGRGGMGVVLKAHDSELNRPIAIKVLAPHLASHGTARKRFAQEAIAAAAVLHPNVIAVHSVNNEGKTPYIVMPYVSGPSLQSLVDQQGPLAEIEIVRIALQISGGLAAAHSQGLVHRDIKPANILVEEGVNRVLITDFGLARAEDDASLTRTGWLTGTPNYMSPEQARGDRPDQRSDLFSLGSLIYFLASGRLPFRAETPLGVLQRIQHDNPTPIRNVNAQVSKTLSDIIGKLLRKHPDGRFQTAAELHEFLERHLAYLHQPDVSTPPQVEPIAPLDWRKLATSRVANLTVGTLILTAILTAAWWGLSPPGTPGSGLPAPAPAPSPAPLSGYAAILVDGERSDEERFRDANELLEAGKYDEALVAYQSLLNSEKLKAVAHYNIGCIYAKTQKPSEAVESLRRAASLGFANSEHYRNDQDLRSLQQNEQFNALITYLDTEDQAAELLKEANREAEQERYEAAEAMCREALKLSPENADAYTNLGYALHLQGKYDEALQWHRKSAASEQYAALGNYNIGCYYAIQNDSDNAFLHLNKAVAADLPDILGSAHIRTDSDLDNIRSDERFEAFAKNFRRRASTIYRSQRGTHRVMNSNIGGDLSGDTLKLMLAGNIAGDWECEVTGDHCELLVVRTLADDAFECGYATHLDVSEFSPFPQDSAKAGAEQEYEITRDAGSLKFKGEFSNGNGQGTFEFIGSDTFRNKLKERGLIKITDALLFRFFFNDDDENAEMIENIQALDKLDLDSPTRMVLQIDGVDADLVSAYQTSEIDTSENLLFIVGRVSPELLLEYKAAGLSLDENKKWINQRVPATLLLEYQNAGFHLDQQAEFIQARVPASLLLAYQDHDFDLVEAAKFIQGRVDPEFLVEYRDATLDFRTYGNFINSRVPAKLLKDYRDAGFVPKKHKRFLEGRVPVDLLQNYRKASLDLDENRGFIQNRVPASLLESYRAAGLDLDKHRDFILSRIDPNKILQHRKDRSDSSVIY